MTDERLALAIDLARQAGALLREGLDKAKHISRKGAIDLVTDYDYQSEAVLIKGLRRAFPHDSLVSEESGESGNGEFVWYIDPLDGTANFSHGLPVFSVSVACYLGRQPLLGVIFNPARDELFHAVVGKGAWLNGEPLSVSSTSHLNDSLLVTGFPYDLRTNPDNNLDHFVAFATTALDLRRFGSASLDLATVAAGRLDGHWELRLSPWDWAAGVLLVREAGGRVTRVDGGTDLFVEPGSILATNGLIHDECLAVLNRKKG